MWAIILQRVDPADARIELAANQVRCERRRRIELRDRTRLGVRQ